MTGDSATVRAYRAADRAEFVRLLRQVYESMHGVYGGDPPILDLAWEERLISSIDARLGRDVAIFVIDGENGSLAAVGGGRISEGLPSPRRRHVREGYIEWIGTDLPDRRRGYASAITQRLLRWFRESDALSVSLNASPDAAALYARLGFTADGPRALSIRMDEPTP